MRSTTRSTGSSPARWSARTWSARSRSAPMCPVFVLEYLLGKYCASSDEMAIQMGLQVVNDTLADNYIRPDEAHEGPEQGQGEGQAHLHRQGEGAAGRLAVLGRGHQLRAQVRPHPGPLRARLRPPADRRHLGAGGHALRVRRGDQGQVPVLDRQAHADPARHLRPGGVPPAARRSSRPTSGSTSWSAAWATSRRSWSGGSSCSSWRG